ncbi:MAG: flavodoxin family protein [Spirochaetota bacterium]
MNTLILNGETSDSSETILYRVKETLIDECKTRGRQVTAYDLASMEIKPCNGCFHCWVKTPGLCIIHDAQAEILKSMVKSDLIVLLTPITFGGYSSNLKKVLDRFIPILLPFFKTVNNEIHHFQRYKQRRRLVAVGTLPEADEEAEGIFRYLLKRNGVNMDATNIASLILYEKMDAVEVKRNLQELLATGEAA